MQTHKNVCSQYDKTTVKEPWDKLSSTINSLDEDCSLKDLNIEGETCEYYYTRYRLSYNLEKWFSSLVKMPKLKSSTITDVSKMNWDQFNELLPEPSMKELHNVKFY